MKSLLLTAFNEELEKISSKRLQQAKGVAGLAGAGAAATWLAHRANVTRKRAKAQAERKETLRKSRERADLKPLKREVEDYYEPAGE